MLRLHLALFVLLTPAVCAQPMSVSDSLDAVYDQFSAAYRAANAAAVAALYTEDAHYLPPGRGILQGREAIERVFAGFLGRYDPGSGPDIEFEIHSRTIQDSTAQDIGVYTIDEAFRGKFVVLWQRGADGRWEIAADIYNDLID